MASLSLERKRKEKKFGSKSRNGSKAEKCPSQIDVPQGLGSVRCGSPEHDSLQPSLVSFFSKVFSFSLALCRTNLDSDDKFQWCLRQLMVQSMACVLLARLVGDTPALGRGPASGHSCSGHGPGAVGWRLPRAALL